jgi:hypothetical protein
MLFIENQNRDCIFTIGGDTCRIKLDKGSSVHRIFINYSSNNSEEIARYSSYDKAKKVYEDLIRCIAVDKHFTMPNDID